VGWHDALDMLRAADAAAVPSSYEPLTDEELDAIAIGHCMDDLDGNYRWVQMTRDQRDRLLAEVRECRNIRHEQVGWYHFGGTLRGMGSVTAHAGNANYVPVFRRVGENE
jgi:hypothetical protein